MADRLLLLWCGLILVAPTLAEDEQVPDSEFLEYLGMWEETDEEWVLHEELEQLATETRSGPAPESEEPPEKEDES